MWVSSFTLSAAPPQGRDPLATTEPQSRSRPFGEENKCISQQKPKDQKDNMARSDCLLRGGGITKVRFRPVCLADKEMSTRLVEMYTSWPTANKGAWHQSIRSSIPGRYKKFVSTPKHPDQLQTPIRLVPRGPSLGVKRLVHEVNQSCLSSA
jgi:hypothetical protein